ncbi:MAG: glycosyltransferase [Nitrospirae bacterium]|nr:glycosyltransferase [Nitrospirota bacterium]
MAEKRGLPWISTVLSPMSFFSAHDPSLIPAAPWMYPLCRFSRALYRGVLGLAKAMTASWEGPLHDLRAEIGLPRAKHPAMFEGQFSPRMNLALFSSRLAEPQPDWPVNTEVCGFARYDGPPSSGAAAGELNAFLESGEPPIVFTLGSSVSMDPGDFFAKAFEAARRLNRRAILVTGGSVSDGFDGSERVKRFDYLPYSEVFPGASVIVHPGGVGTLSQALAAGRPMLVVPVAFDQPDNARRAVRLGVARAIPFSDVTAGKLTDHLSALLADPEIRDRAAGVSTQVRTENGAERACALIEKTASSF